MSCSGERIVNSVYFISCQKSLKLWEEATLSQINSLRNIHVCNPYSVQFTSSYNHILCCHPYVHSSYRYNGWACPDGQLVSIYEHQSHRHDNTHPCLFMSWWALWLGSFSNMLWCCSLEDPNRGELVSELWQCMLQSPEDYPFSHVTTRGSVVIDVLKIYCVYMEHI